MKRNTETLLWILNAAESCGGSDPIVLTDGAMYGGKHYQLQIGDRNFDQVYEHILYLGDAGLAVVRELGRKAVALDRLTMRGHDFLEAVQDDHPMQRAKSPEIRILVNEWIMGDKFEQVSDSTIVNRSDVNNAFNTHTSEQAKPLAEAAAEIQELLIQLEKTNPTATEAEQITYVNIATKPDLKQRVIAALKEGSYTAIDEFILDNKYLKVAKSVFQGWIQPNG